MIVYYGLLLAIVLYVVFLAAPTLVVCLTVFGKKQGIPLTERDLRDTYYAPYLPKIHEDFAWFREQECQRVTIRAFDGAQLVGDYYPTQGRKLVICMHGYSSTPLNGFSAMGRFLMEMGYDLLLVHQRGHGVSGGNRSTMGILEQEDVLSWSQWACDRAETETVVFAGLSMGCAAVAYASDRLLHPKIKGMILDCGFTSPYNQMWRTCLERHLPPRLMMAHVWFFTKLLFRMDITRSTTENLSRTRIPALFIHGREDKAVPVSEVEENYRSCASEKQLYIAENARHACAFLAGGEEAGRTVRAFLNSISE